MKRVLILLSILVCTLCLHAEKLKIAILDLKSGVGCTQDAVDGLSDMLSMELFNSGYFIIVERSQVNRVLQANNLYGKQLSENQLKSIGNTLKVDAVLVGTVNYIVRDVKRASDGVSKINSGEYNVDIRLMSVADGRMLSSAGDEGRGRTDRELMTSVAQQLIRNLDSSIKKENSSVQVLYDYLYVFPEDLGSFSSCPTGVIDITNRNNLYGYNDWRLPTEEEVSIMEANSTLLHLDKGVNYAHQYSWSRSSGKYQVRLVRTKVVVQQRTQNRIEPYFERTSHDFGVIQILSGKVTTKFCLQNPSSRNITIENVTKTNSSITVSWDKDVIPSGSKGFVTVIYNPNGRQGVSFNSSINVIISTGQHFTLYITGKVE